MSCRCSSDCGSLQASTAVQRSSVRGQPPTTCSRPVRLTGHRHQRCVGRSTRLGRAAIGAVCTREKLELDNHPNRILGVLTLSTADLSVSSPCSSNRSPCAGSRHQMGQASARSTAGMHSQKCSEQHSAGITPAHDTSGHPDKTDSGSGPVDAGRASSS